MLATARDMILMVKDVLIDDGKNRVFSPDIVEENGMIIFNRLIIRML